MCFFLDVLLVIMQSNKFKIIWDLDQFAIFYSTISRDHDQFAIF